MNIIKIEKDNLKKSITNDILCSLPDWFGIPESIVEYVNEASELPMWAVYVDNELVGFISLKQHNKFTAEILVMGVDLKYHRKGIGKLLVTQCIEWCKNNQIEYLQVKTLDESNTDKSYAKTREFYKAMGFRPVECFPTLWGEANPCLLMIMFINNLSN